MFPVIPTPVLDDPSSDPPTSQGVTDIDRYVAEFGPWVGEFRRILGNRASDTPDPSEVTIFLLQWVDRLRELGSAGALRAIGSQRAEELLFFLNHALDDLGDEYRRWGATQATMLLALSPVEDILAYLALIASASTEPIRTTPTEADSEFEF
jgi:hypothetical protein